MRAFVFTDTSLARHAGQFVWLALDIDDAANSQFLVKFPVTGTPTLIVIDPKSESVALRYLGGASVPQIEQLLHDGEALVRGKQLSGADEALERADRLENANQSAQAAEACEEAIASAPKKWSRFGRAAETLIATLRHARDYKRCASRAVDLYPQLAGTASGAAVADRGLTCALRLADEQKPDPDLTAALAKAVGVEIQNPKNRLLDGDRAALYLSLIGERRRAHDDAATQSLREELAAYLEQKAAAAQTPAQRASYDFYRARVYRDLGQPEKSIPMLEQTERDFPNDYIPPLWLSRAYSTVRKYDEALAASDRALARVSGAGRTMVLDLRSDLYAARGDKAMAMQALRDAIAFSESLPPGQHDQSTIDMLKKKLDKM